LTSSLYACKPIFNEGGGEITSEIDLADFCCLNTDCPDYGLKNQGNIVVKERYGKSNHALLKCRTCKHCFSETRGTAFFELDTPQEEVLRTLAMIPEKGSIRGVARATGHDKDTICRWVEIAGAHSNEVTTYFLKDLNLEKVEVDEIWSYIKKSKRT
jgi:transposase-like protein